MHHESELTREKTQEDVEENQATHHPEYERSPSTQSETDSNSHDSIEDVNLVTFRPGEPADPHNWSKVSRIFGSLLSRHYFPWYAVVGLAQ